jgi:hypothetical protein
MQAINGTTDMRHRLGEKLTNLVVFRGTPVALLVFRAGGHYDEEDDQTRSLDCFACVRDNISYGLRFYLP